jgi:elongation factor Ts
VLVVENQKLKFLIEIDFLFRIRVFSLFQLMNIVRRRSAFRGFARCYSSAPPTKPSISLVAELRKQTQVPLSKIREAIVQSNNSIPDALLWLEKDMVASGQSKLAKVGSRSTTQGVIAISTISEGGGFKTAGGVRAAMVELNCETDFVGRNELFTRLASDIAHTAAFISEAKKNTNEDPQVEFNPISVDELEKAPLIVPSYRGVKYNRTVQTSIRDAIVKIGENISLRRAISIVEDAPLERPTTTALRLGSYIHGSSSCSPLCGRIGALVLLSLRSPQLSRRRISKQFRENLSMLERSLARQIIAFPSLKSIRPTPENREEEEALYKQKFITFPGELNNSLVEEALKKWSISEGLMGPGQDESGIEVLRFAQWNVGDEI